MSTRNRNKKKNTNNNSSQISLERWAQAGYQMKNMRKKDNGAKAINLNDGTGWSNDKKEFVRIFKELKKNDNNKKILGKHFAKRWCDDYEWFYVKFGIINANGSVQFDPEIVCYVCNKYYSEHPFIKFKGQCKFVNARKLLTNESQKSAMDTHDGCDTHCIVDEKESKESMYKKTVKKGKRKTKNIRRSS